MNYMLVTRTVLLAGTVVKRLARVTFVPMENSATLAALGREQESAFGARVKRFRQANGWTQDDLSKRMTAEGFPMHQTTVAKLESGGRPTSIAELTALAALFGVPIPELFTAPNDDDEAQASVLVDVSIRGISRIRGALVDALNQNRQELLTASEELEDRIRAFEVLAGHPLTGARTGAVEYAYRSIAAMNNARNMAFERIDGPSTSSLVETEQEQD